MRPTLTRAGVPKKVAGVAVAALLLAGVAIPLAALRGLSSRSAFRTAPAASSNVPAITGQLVATTTKLQPGNRGLAVAFGDVWVVGPGSTGLLRLDGTTGAVKATIPVKGEDGTLVAGAGGFVWVTEGSGSIPQTITAVDPATNSVAGTLSVPGMIEGLVTYQGELWASISPFGVGGSLVQIDPASIRVVKTVPVGVAGSLSVVGSSFWIHTSGFTSSVQFDPATLSPGMKLEPSFASHVVFAGGLFWSVAWPLSTSGAPSEETETVIGVDPATGKTVATLPAPRAADLAASSTGVWVFSVPGTLPDNAWDPSRPATVSLIDPVARAFVGTPVPVDLSPAWIATADDGALWIKARQPSQLTSKTLPDATSPRRGRADKSRLAGLTRSPSFGEPVVGTTPGGPPPGHVASA
jgi:hypothetical protein